MSTGPGARLAKEIYDEFLVCKMCFAAFKNPKSLSCLHTFCEKCIENQFPSESSYKRFTDFKEFSCPLCHERTKLPTGGVHGLPDNFTVSGLLAIVGPQCPDASKCLSCDVCKRLDRKHHEAITKCLDCVKLLCADCAKIHREMKVTSGHSLYGIQVDKDVQCKHHPDEAVRFYCIPCDACVCVLCTFNQHLDHEVIQFADAVSDCRHRIATLLAACKGKARDLGNKMESVDRCEEVIANTTQKIKEAADQFVQDVQSAEQRLLEELQQIFGPEVIGQLETKKDLCTVVEGMRSTCDITDVVLAGKDLELLLLKRDVEEKLTSMNSININDLPLDCVKNIDFLPGLVDFGYLCHRDGDQSVKQLERTGPGPSNNNEKTRRQNSDVIQPLIKTRELAVQTEGDCKVFQENSGNDREGKVTLKVQTGTMTDDHLDRPASVVSSVSPTSPLGNQLDQNEQERRRRRRKDPAQPGKISPGTGFSYSSIESK